jgi:hypothetical protein
MNCHIWKGYWKHVLLFIVIDVHVELKNGHLRNNFRMSNDFSSRKL